MLREPPEFGKAKRQKDASTAQSTSDQNVALVANGNPRPPANEAVQTRKQAYRASKVCTLGRCNRHKGCPKSEIKGPAPAWLAAKKRQTDTPLLRNAVLSNRAQQSLNPAPQRVFGPADRRSSKSVQPAPAGLAESASHNNNTIFKTQAHHFAPMSSTIKEG